jgi:hypothetical protein
MDKKSGFPAAWNGLNANSLHRCVNSLFQDHFLIFFQSFTAIQTLVLVLAGSNTIDARAFYHHDASYREKIFGIVLYISIWRALSSFF